jgi:hypothetical protein
MPVKNYFDNLYKILGRPALLAQRLVYAGCPKMWVECPTIPDTIG